MTNVGHRRTGLCAPPGGDKPLPYQLGAAICLILIVVASGCTSRGGAYHERGIASWYGGKFQGRRTANGEIYDMHKMTAAHKTLPFNTMVEVRNLTNGRTTVVRINDRGPFVRGRIIDLSLSGAKAIGMVGPGTARVEIRALKRVDAVIQSHFTLQVGSFRQRNHAEDLRANPAFGHYGASIEPHGPFFRVLVGDFSTRKKAMSAARELERQGFNTFIRAL